MNEVVASESIWQRQIIPIALTGVVFLLLVLILRFSIIGLNLLTPTDIVLQIHVWDVIIGLTIYLKTSIDFAIFIGNLIARFPTWKDRVAIEIGTAFGNALGTLAVLVIWAFFKEVRWLLALMIVLAALVLIRLAQDGLEHVSEGEKKYPDWFYRAKDGFAYVLGKINKVIAPLMRFLIPHMSPQEKRERSFWSLFGLAVTIPFILGLDDFAGYVPLFTIIQVYGFAIGVFLGHMILNVFLYISPARTIKAVKHPLISFAGSVAFVLLALWGIKEAIHLLIA